MTLPKNQQLSLVNFLTRFQVVLNCITLGKVNKIELIGTINKNKSAIIKVKSENTMTWGNNLGTPNTTAPSTAASINSQMTKALKNLALQINLWVKL
jgi:hypothetical protein